MKTLHLNLKKKWFDMILSGEKIEEYREIKKSYISKFITTKYFNNGNSRNENHVKSVIDLILEHPFHFEKNRMEHFDTITFSNGYSKNRPQFVIELKGIEIREGNPKWGAEPGVRYFVLKLGGVIKTENL